MINSNNIKQGRFKVISGGERWRNVKHGGWGHDGGRGQGQGHSSEYRANVPLVPFNSFHLRGLGQSGSSSQIVFILNLYLDGEWMSELLSLSLLFRVLKAWFNVLIKPHFVPQTNNKFKSTQNISSVQNLEGKNRRGTNVRHHLRVSCKK